MTLVQASKVFRIYVNPGTEDDGYPTPEWRVWIRPHFWEGGGGDWTYVGHVGSGSLDDPDRVYLFRMGEDEVRRFLDSAQEQGMEIERNGSGDGTA